MAWVPLRMAAASPYKPKAEFGDSPAASVSAVWR